MCINPDQFFLRMKRFYDAWKDGCFGEMDCLANVVDNFESYTKSTAFALWLFGDDSVIEHLIILTVECIHIVVTSEEVLAILRSLTLREPKETSVPNVKLYSSESELKFLIISLIKNKTVGIITGGKCISPWAVSSEATIANESIHTIDISTGIAYLLGQKDDEELKCVYEGCFMVEEVFTQVEQRIADIIKNYTNQRHSEIGNEIIAIVNQTVDYDDDDTENYDIKIIYPPIIQSSGGYCLNFNATNDTNCLCANVIICSLGVRCRNYCSNIVRTLVKKPTKSIEQNYNLLLEVEEEILKGLKANVKLRDVYENVIKFVKSKNPEMVKHLTDDFGFAMGTEFKDNSLIIGPKANTIAKEGMIFNVNVGFSNLINEEEIGKREEIYALWIGDTVLINEDQMATRMTLHDKQWSSIAVQENAS